MKILTFSKKDGVLVVRPSNLNDLFHLSKVLEPKDLVSAHTTRKIKLGGEDTRSRTSRTSAYVQVETVKIDLDYPSETLRVAGKIKNGQENIPLDSAHTLSLSAGVEITVKKQWKQHQLDRLRQAERQTAEAKVLVCVLDDEEASFASLSDVGVGTLGSFEFSLARKAEGAEQEKDQLLKIVQHLEYLDKDLNPRAIVIASPSFWKDSLYKVVKEKYPKLLSKIKLESVNSAGGAGINELLGKGVLAKAEQESRLQQEFSLVEEVKVKIARKGLAEYGFLPVKKAAEKASIDKLLLSERTVQDFRDKNRYAEIEELVDLVEQSKGLVFIISSEHDAGQVLDGLGGVAALLRYK